MPQIFKSLGILLGAILGIYGVLLAASLIIYPPRSETSMDTRNLNSSIFINEPRYIVWNRAPLATPGQKIIFVGSSNFRNAITLDEIRPILPDIGLHNITAGSANIGMMGRAVDLALEAIPKDTWRNTTFVIGIVFGNFNDDRRAWGGLPSPLDREMVRFGFYQIEGNAIRNVVPVPLIPWLDIALRPYLALARLRYIALTFERENIVETPVSDDARFEDANKRWSALLRTPGVLDEKPFDDLASVARRIVTQGAQLVVVDMPVAEWFGARSLHYADYQEHKTRRLAPILGLEGVHYIDLQAMDRAELFSDSTHPNPTGATELSRAVAQQLRQLLLGSNGGN